MNFFRRHWNNFIDYLQYNKKRIIINFIVFLSIFTILILMDLLTKQFLFDEFLADSDGLEIQHKNWLFGIRSVKNTGLTFATKSNANIPLVTFFNILILLICLCSVIFLRSWIFSLFVGFIFAGSLGNTIDRLAFGYVRDIIFLPWADHGTFNFADCDVIIGCCGVVISLFAIFFYDYYKGRNK